MTNTSSTNSRSRPNQPPISNAARVQTSLTSHSLSHSPFDLGRLHGEACERTMQWRFGSGFNTGLANQQSHIHCTARGPEALRRNISTGRTRNLGQAFWTNPVINTAAAVSIRSVGRFHPCCHLSFRTNHFYSPDLTTPPRRCRCRSL